MLTLHSVYKSIPVFLILSFGPCAVSNAQVQTLTLKEKDALYLSNPWKAFWRKFDVKHPSVQVAVQYSIEKTSTKQYQSPFIYSSKFDEAFPIGFKIGASWDIQYKKKKNWRANVYLNYLSSSLRQVSAQSLPPLIGTYYAYPFKNPTWYLGMQLLYKKSLYNSKTSKMQIDWVVGPGIDLQISPQNIDQQQYKKANYYILTGNTGINISNKKSQTIGLHYQYGSNAFNSSIKSTLTAWQLSVLIPLQHQK